MMFCKQSILWQSGIYFKEITVLSQLKSLTFMGHKFNGQQESDLTSCLQKVDRLDLRYCKVSDAGLKSMKDTVCITFVVHC